MAKKRARKSKMWILVLLLAILCIGGVELAVCRVMDPALYARITAPVRALVLQLGEKAGALKDSVVERFAPPPAPELEAREAPEEQNAASPAFLGDSAGDTDGAVTSFQTSEGQEMLLGGNYSFVYYNQTDPQWSTQPYGSDQIGGYGCGPTALAMVISSMTQQPQNPAQMAAWAKDNGHWAKKRGSYHSLIQAGAGAFGLYAEPLYELGAERLKTELASGRVFIALMTRGHFTSSGHFIVLRGLSADGRVLVADPSSRERSLSLWDAQLIIDELSRSRNDGAPLWGLSPYWPQQGS